MSQDIEVLYIYTTMIEGEEKVIVGADGVPFIYLSMEALIQNHTSEKMQLWANTMKVKMQLKMFTPVKTIDIIEPMRTDLIM